MGCSAPFNLHVMADAKDCRCDHRQASRRACARIAVTGAPEQDRWRDMMARLPKLEIVSTFGVGYDHIDIKWAGEHGITVTNTPDVLNEEVADTALGLLLCTVREFPQAERFLRAGKWMERDYPLTPATLARPHRRHGRHGPHRPGDRAAARRLQGAGGLSQPQAAGGRALRHYPEAGRHGARRRHAHAAIMPGGPATQALINAEVLDALGPDGIFINMARGSVVDEAALIKALQEQDDLCRPASTSSPRSRRCRRN